MIWKPKRLVSQPALLSFQVGHNPLDTLANLVPPRRVPWYSTLWEMPTDLLDLQSNEGQHCVCLVDTFPFLGSAKTYFIKLYSNASVCMRWVSGRLKLTEDESCHWEIYLLPECPAMCKFEIIQCLPVCSTYQLHSLCTDYIIHRSCTSEETASKVRVLFQRWSQVFITVLKHLVFCSVSFQTLFLEVITPGHLGEADALLAAKVPCHSADASV